MNCTPTRYDWSTGMPKRIHPRMSRTMRTVLDTVVFGWAIGGIVLALLLLLSGCAGPPQSISLDPTFTPAEVAAIGDARDQWCAANGWCPSFVTDGEWHFVRNTGSGPMAPGEERATGHTEMAESTTFIDGDALDSWPEMAWIVVAHEMGHAQGIQHHGSADATMFWFHDAPSFELIGEN